MFFRGVKKDLDLGRSSSPVFGSYESHASFYFHSFRFWNQYFGFFIRYSTFVKSFKFFQKTFSSGSSIRNFFITRFYLKGIGYKFLRPKLNRGFLRVELGYSVSNYIKIPSFIRVFNKRDRVMVFGSVKSSVTDFSSKLYKLRAADVYRGKGVRISTIEYKNFKPGKQR